MRYKIDEKYIKTGIVAFTVIAASIILFFAIYRIDGLMSFFSSVGSVIAPFVYGLVVAYLLCPLYNVTVRGCMKVQFFKRGKKDKSRIIAKVLASIVSLLALFGVIIGLLWMVIPGMIESISAIIKTLPEQVNAWSKWAEDTIANMQETTGPMAVVIDTAINNAQNWVDNTIIPASENMIGGLSNTAFGILSGIWNFIIGVIICTFFLNSKEIFAAQARKMIFAATSEERAHRFLYGTHYVNRTFGKFINGKLIDSLVIGVLCFIFMSIVNWPYAMLISVIVGVTNIIPFFGPFIGAIPSALLMLMVDPLLCLYFLIFILILQQLDGNVIGPKILGGSTGLPSFWIMFAILVGGGMFGFAGMILGIPVFACVYAYTAYSVNKKLDQKGMSTDLGVYKKMDSKLDEEFRENNKGMLNKAKTKKKAIKRGKGKDESKDKKSQGPQDEKSQEQQEIAQKTSQETSDE